MEEVREERWERKKEVSKKKKFYFSLFAQEDRDKSKFGLLILHSTKNKN